MTSNQIPPQPKNVQLKMSDCPVCRKDKGFSGKVHDCLWCKFDFKSHEAYIKHINTREHYLRWLEYGMPQLDYKIGFAYGKGRRFNTLIYNLKLPRYREKIYTFKTTVTQKGIFNSSNIEVTIIVYQDGQAALQIEDKIVSKSRISGANEPVTVYAPQLRPDLR